MAAALFLAVLLAYSNSFHAGFAFDSSLLILQDARVHQANGANFDLILNHTYWWPSNESGLYRPVTTLSYLFNYAILGDGAQPDAYHWINFLLHVFNVFLVYLLAVHLVRRVWPAFFVAAVWAVHPVLTESVTNIAGRADLLAATALLAGFLMYLKSTESKGWQRGAYLAGLMAVTTLGVFSKESAVAILGIIVIYEMAFWKERKQLRGLLFGCAALAPPLLFLWYRRSVVLSASGPRVFLFVQNPILNATFLRGRLTAIGVMAKYLWLFLWPLKLSCDYSYNQIPVASGTLHDWVAWIAVAGVIIGAASMYRRSPTALFLAGFAFLTFVPVSNLLFLIGTIMADRFLYVPAIGCAGCLVLAIYAISRRIAWPPFAPIALCLIIAVLCIRTWERNFDWSDDVTLWTAAVRSAPNSFKSHDALAYALNQSDPSHSKINQTIEEADASLAILDPLPNSLNTAYSYVNAGNYFQTKGDLLLQREPDGEVTDTPESRLAYQISLEILLRGAAIDRATNEQHRIEELGRGKQESEITPTGLPLLYDGLAVTYLRLGDSKDAYDAAVYARLLAPQIPDTYILIGEALSTSGRKKDAAVSFMEGMLVTGDQRFFPLLQSQYRSGLDPAGCSFVQTANGPAINYSCEAVHNSVCGASAELTRVFLQGHQHDLAVALKNKALGQFGCSPEKLE